MQERRKHASPKNNSKESEKRETPEMSIQSDFPKQLMGHRNDFFDTDLIHATRIERAGEGLRVIDVHTRTALQFVIDGTRTPSYESVKFRRLRAIHGENGYSEG